MTTPRMCVPVGPCALVLALLFAATATGADNWISITPDNEVAIAAPALAAPPNVTVARSSETGLDVVIEVPGLAVGTRETKGGEFVELGWPDAATAGAIGSPKVPVVREVFVAPVGASVTLTADAGEGFTVDSGLAGVPLRLVPVQLPIPKVPGAREKAVFQFDEVAYGLDANLPAERATVEEVGIIRGQRLLLLTVYPVAYNPVRQTITFWPNLSAEIRFAGAPKPSSNLSPVPGLSSTVLNPELLPDDVGRGRGSGKYLIVVASTYASTITSFANAKAAQGFTVETYSVPSGTSASTIKSYISSWYSSSVDCYVLLVGDTDTIPAWTGGGSYSPDTDLPYACMDGSSDWHPDLAIGRFSVRSTGDLQDVINKTLYVENGSFADPDYLLRAVFMASEDNYTVSEGTHNYVISNYMDPNGFSSDKLYCHTYGATTQQTRNSFNNGRIYGIYSGHGGSTSWGDGPAFSQSDVRGLTNANMYAFVCSFACLTGDFKDYTECFTETWLVEGNKGAAAMYGASVSSWWDEDDYLERELFEAIYDDGIREVSPAWQAAFVEFEAHFGTDNDTRMYFEMYNLMGDPSLYIPEPGGGAHMTVSPTGGLTSQGPVGGPFTPNSLDYTLENNAAFPIAFSVSDNQPWVSITNPTGTIPVSGSAQVTVSINSSANSLGSGHYDATVNFINTTDHDGDTTRPVSLDVGVPMPVYSFPMDTNPGWTIQGQWQFGHPTGGGGEYGGPDPTSGHTGSNVYGYNLSGDYTNGMPEYHLTSTAIDCSNLSQVRLKFWRWLGVETVSYDHAYLRVSNDGSQWTEIWANTDYVEDASWSQREFDISSVADGEETVYLRWTMGTTDGSWRYCGWNIDDVEIWGIEQDPCAGITPDGDVDGDGYTDGADVQAFTDGILGSIPQQQVCRGDFNGNKVLDVGDIDGMVDSLLTP
ncbi:MAG: hypothetical protein JXQ75_22465 [Phycisphaerae bacterium]|nr:hypothetical protein [Phycisphaerae bacterium]